jgi:tellurite resistance protein TerC
VPHARLENITQPVVIFAQSREGIPVKDSSERIHLIFMLLTSQSTPMQQVRLLARISGIMQSEYVVECLREYQNPTQLFEVIRAADPAILS